MVVPFYGRFPSLRARHPRCLATRNHRLLHYRASVLPVAIEVHRRVVEPCEEALKRSVPKDQRKKQRQVDYRRLEQTFSVLH